MYQVSSLSSYRLPVGAVITSHHRLVSGHHFPLTLANSPHTLICYFPNLPTKKLCEYHILFLLLHQRNPSTEHSCCAWHKFSYMLSSCTEVQLIYNVLISAVQQSDSVIHIYFLILFLIMVYLRISNTVPCATQ